MSTAPHEPGRRPRAPGRPRAAAPPRRAARLLGTAAAGAMLLGAAAAALGPGAGRAQDGGGTGGGTAGPRLTLGVGSEIRLGRDVTVDEERGDLLSETDLTFGIRSETQTQSLLLTFGGTYRVLPLEGAAAFTGPDARLRYAREAAGGALTLTGSVRTRDLDFVRGLLLGEEGEILDFDEDGLVFDEDGVIDADDLETGTGTRRITRLGFSLDLLRDRPVGIEVSGDLRRTDFDEADADFDESRREALDAALRLRLAPTLTARLTYGLDRLEVDRDPQDEPDDDVRRDRDSYGVSLSYAVTPRLDANAALQRTRSEIEELDGDEIEETALTGSAGLAYALPRGSIGLRYARRLEQGEERDQVTLSRRFELPGEDALALQLGYATFGDGDALTGALDWTRRGPRGDLQLGLSRSVGSGIDDGFSTRTRLTASYGRQLTALTGLGLRAEFGRVEEADGETGEAGLLRASVNRRLTRDWSLSGGVETTFEEDGEDDTAVFARVSRSFDLLP